MDAASGGGWPPYHGDNDDSSSSSGGSSGNSGMGSSSGSEFGGTGSSYDISSSPTSSARVPASFPPPPSPFLNPDYEDDDFFDTDTNSMDESSSTDSSSSSSSRKSGSSTPGGRIPWIEGRPSKAKSSLPANPRRRARLRSHRESGMEGEEGGGGFQDNGSKDKEKRKGPTKFRGIRTSLSEMDEQGRFVRSPSVHRNWIEAEGKYRPQANRYHLYVSLACPWSCRCLMVLYLKGAFLLLFFPPSCPSPFPSVPF